MRAADIPNVVAIKYEVGRPGIAGDLEFWKMIQGKRILFSDPLEAHSPLTVEMFGMQWMGTSNYEYWGGAVPQYFKLLLREEVRPQAMEIYWRINPARQARVAIQTTFAGANFIHRYLWKYQGWLHGYNGGPMRQPVMKLNDSQMRTRARAAAEDPASSWPTRQRRVLPRAQSRLSHAMTLLLTHEHVRSLVEHERCHRVHGAGVPRRGRGPHACCRRAST